MKQITLKKMSEAIEKMMLAKDITPKELAQKAKMSYSSLMPVLNGTRECGVSKLVAIAQALGTTPDGLLKGTYVEVKNGQEITQNEPKYLVVFISIIKVTYCLLYKVDSGAVFESVLQFPLRGGDDSESFISNILSALDKFSLEAKENIEAKDVAIFASIQQYGRKANRDKIQLKCEHTFAKFLLESDAISNQNAFIGPKNGICISINDGSIITYSTDAGKTISRLQGYGFPMSDTAGNYWLGCEAIKHVIAVKEQRESGTLISDRLLALFNDDIIFLCAQALDHPHETFLKASAIIKELMHHQQKSYDIVKKSYDLLFTDIHLIDTRTKSKMPIFIAGELAYLYEDFFEQERLIRIDERQSNVLLKYGLEKLKA